MFCGRENISLLDGEIEHLQKASGSSFTNFLQDGILKRASKYVQFSPCQIRSLPNPRWRETITILARASPPPSLPHGLGMHSVAYYDGARCSPLPRLPLFYPAIPPHPSDSFRPLSFQSINAFRPNMAHCTVLVDSSNYFNLREGVSKQFRSLS